MTGLTASACSKVTKQRLDLLLDPRQHRFIHADLRNALQALELLVRQLISRQLGKTHRVDVGREEVRAFRGVQDKILAIAQQHDTMGADLVPLDHRRVAQRQGNAQAPFRRAAALHHALVQHLLEDLEALGAHLPQFAGQAATAQLVVDLLPAQDRTGVLLGIMESTDFGKHDRCSSVELCLLSDADIQRNRLTRGEGACSRWAAKQTPFCERFALKRERAPSPRAHRVLERIVLIAGKTKPVPCQACASGIQRS
jgi:hypothetical protein